MFMHTIYTIYTVWNKCLIDNKGYKMNSYDPSFYRYSAYTGR